MIRVVRLAGRGKKWGEAVEAQVQGRAGDELENDHMRLFATLSGTQLPLEGDVKFG